MTKSFDHLLREVLKGGPAGQPPPPCLDADTAAAWIDGDLSGGDRVIAEAHVSGCPRCQQLLAAMVTTSPAQPVRARWLAPAVRWLVPLTAVAASILVWVSLADRTAETPAVPDLQSGSRAVSISAQKETVPISPPRDERTAAKGEKRRENGERAKDEGTGNKAEARGEKPAADTRQAAAGALADASAPPARPAALADAAVAPPAAAAPPLAVQSAGGLAETATRPDSFPLQRAAPAPPRELMVRASDGGTRWRVSAPGAVQRTVDDGMTWEAQLTGVAEMPAAGASPSPAICWLVGPRGLVLISADGHSWQRVPFPGPLDLVAVRAADEKNATVTARDGRTYTTVDAGRTWKP